MSRLKLQRLLLRLRKLAADRFGRRREVYFEQRVDQYRRMWQAIARAAGARFRELAPDLWELERDGRRTRVCNYQMEFDNPVVLAMAGRKPLMHRLLAGHGLAVPEHLVFRLRELERAEDFLAAHPLGCVIKPANGFGGKVVTTHVQTVREVRRAALLASLYSGELLMEPMVAGECYRLLVLDGHMIHAVKRAGPRLTGDGRRTVAELVAAENRRRRAAGERPLTDDRDYRFTLAYQDLGPQSVPAQGQVFLVKSVNDPLQRGGVEVRTVYNEVVTDQVCDAVRRDAEAAARVLGGEFIGVDLITRDITRPLAEVGGVINEVNTTPALHHHYDSRREDYPQPALQVLESLLAKAP